MYSNNLLLTVIDTQRLIFKKSQLLQKMQPKNTSHEKFWFQKYSNSIIILCMHLSTLLLA